MNNNHHMNSVEKLAIDADSSQQTYKQWQLIPQNLVNLPVLTNHLSVPLNNTEILILGGKG